MPGGVLIQLRLVFMLVMQMPLGAWTRVEPMNRVFNGSPDPPPGKLFYLITWRWLICCSTARLSTLPAFSDDRQFNGTTSVCPPVCLSRRSIAIAQCVQKYGRWNYILSRLRQSQRSAISPFWAVFVSATVFFSNFFGVGASIRGRQRSKHSADVDCYCCWCWWCCLISCWWCSRAWDLMLLLLVKRRSHCSQRCGRSPLWTSRCFCRCASCVKDLRHCSQRNGRSPVWVRKWTCTHTWVYV